MSSCLLLIFLNGSMSEPFSQAMKLVSRIKPAAVWHTGACSQQQHLCVICLLLLCPREFLWVAIIHFVRWHLFLQIIIFRVRAHAYTHACRLHTRQGLFKVVSCFTTGITGFYHIALKIMDLLFCVLTWWHHSAAAGEPGSCETSYIM